MLHALVKAGKVAGLGSGSLFTGASKQKQQQGEFKQAFVKASPVLAVGELVTWVDEDDELPRGVVGKVRGKNNISKYVPVYVKWQAVRRTKYLARACNSTHPPRPLL